MVDSNLLLAGHVVIILSGIFIAFSNNFLSNQRDRLLAGLTLVILGGFTVSTHTWWFHNKYHELGGDIGCSAFGSFSCGDVLANSDWNTVPILGVPWGLMGMFAFSLLGFLVLSIRKEHNATWDFPLILGGISPSSTPIGIASVVENTKITAMKNTPDTVSKLPILLSLSALVVLANSFIFIFSHP